MPHVHAQNLQWANYQRNLNHVPMDQLLNPIKEVQPLCIILHVEGFRAEPHMLRSVPTFHGMKTENIYNFPGEYAMGCTVFSEPDQDHDLVCL